MPSGTYRVGDKSMSGFQVLKDSLVFLLGGNAAGDFKSKQMLIYHSKSPGILKRLNLLYLRSINETIEPG